MDKKTAHVEDEKSAKPKHCQNDTKNEKHCGACFLPETSCRAGATITGGKRGDASDSLLHNRIDEAKPLDSHWQIRLSGACLQYLA